MAVYTELSENDITAFLLSYDVGKLTSFKGIAEGVSNTNYLLHTSSANYILTLFEENFNATDLPFFMNLTEHLGSKGVVCPRPIRSKSGEVIASIKGKPAILIEFLQGHGNPHITPRHLELVGELAAKLHLSVADFSETRANDLSIAGLKKIFAGFCGRANEIKSGLENEIKTEFEFLEKNLPKNLPAGVVHTDIFPDNVFFIDGYTDQPELSGIIDFYFSCTDFFAYDLAIILNAWCFDTSHKFIPARAEALFKGYNSVRSLTDVEKNALPILARAAAMRFLCTRARDWLNPAQGALVNMKDPMEYVKKLHFWQAND